MRAFYDRVTVLQNTLQGDSFNEEAAFRRLITDDRAVFWKGLYKCVVWVHDFQLGTEFDVSLLFCSPQQAEHAFTSWEPGFRVYE